jgi:NAD-dependent deacetylase
VVVTGAGISTEAGIPDFRGEHGIYRSLGERQVMNIINIEAFHRDPRQFYEFYRKYFMYAGVEPSHAHRVLAVMEQKGLIKGVVTQNIDNLHERAGSKQVISVHGNADRFSCIMCFKAYDAAYVQKHSKLVPTCAACGGVLRPDVVLYGEPIKEYRHARETILGASLVIVIGSSLTVFPLAGFVEEYACQTRELIIINKGPTALDHLATVRLEAENTGLLLDEIVSHIT